jgi:SAM-dependent methyltransferase
MKETIEIKICEGLSLKRSRKEIIRERICPRPWQWGYLGLKPILKEVKNFSTLAKREGVQNILDLGCGVKPYKSLFAFAKKYVGADISREESEADFIAPAWNLPFLENEFDALISTQALEHTKKVSEAVLEMKRVVKPGGLIFVSVPLTFPEHGMPHDYFRFTRYGLREIFKDFEILYILPLNGYLNTIIRLINVFLHYIPGSQYFLFPLFLINNFLGVVLDKFAYLIFKALEKITGLEIFHKVYLEYYLGFPENYVLVARNKK